MTRHQPLLAARPASWIEHPEAAALLADCATNPPARKHRVDTYAITADHWSEYSRRDPRVHRLWQLWDEAYEAAVAAGEDAGPVLGLTPEQAIARVAILVRELPESGKLRRRAA